MCQNWSICYKEGEGESVYDGEREEESVCENWSPCDGEGESVCLCAAKGILSDEKIWGGKEENITARRDMKIIREKETKLWGKREGQKVRILDIEKREREREREREIHVGTRTRVERHED